MTTATLATDATTDKAPVRRVAGLFWPHRWSIAVMLTVSVAQGAAGVASPFLVSEIIDQALPQRNDSLVVHLQRSHDELLARHGRYAQLHGTLS